MPLAIEQYDLSKLRHRDLQQPRGRQGRHHRARPAPYLLLLHARCATPGTCSISISGNRACVTARRGAMARCCPAPDADLGHAHGSRRRSFHRLLGLHRPAHPEVYRRNIDGDLSERGGRRLHDRRAPARTSTSPPRAWCPTRRCTSSSRHSRKMPDRKLVVIGDGPQFKRIQGLRRPQCDAARLPALQVLLSHLQRGEGLHLRCRGRFRYRAARGAGLRHAGARLRQGRCARDRDRRRHRTAFPRAVRSGDLRCGQEVRGLARHLRSAGAAPARRPLLDPGVPSPVP